LADGTVKSGALIGRHRKGLLFHPHLTIHRLTALTFFSVALMLRKSNHFIYDAT